MLALKRIAKITAILAVACAFTVPACTAETIASYSGQYTADLEQKQAFLESIKEDTVYAEAALRQESGTLSSSKPSNLSRLGVDRICLAEIMPASEKIHIALISMNGTLSPQVRESHPAPIREDRSRK